MLPQIYSCKCSRRKWMETKDNGWTKPWRYRSDLWSLHLDLRLWKDFSELATRRHWLIAYLEHHIQSERREQNTMFDYHPQSVLKETRQWYNCQDGSFKRESGWLIGSCRQWSKHHRILRDRQNSWDLCVQKRLDCSIHSLKQHHSEWTAWVLSKPEWCQWVLPFCFWCDLHLRVT